MGTTTRNKRGVRHKRFKTLKTKINWLGHEKNIGPDQWVTS